MKALITGTERSEGISKKTNKPYAIGRIYAALPLAGGEGVRGFAGSQYDCEPSLLDKLKDVDFPVYCDLEMQDVMRYGNRKQEVVSIVISRAPAVGAVSQPKQP